MHGAGWGPDGPPAEAYERVSDPERFRGLHDVGRALLDEIEAHHDVRRAAFVDDGRPYGPEPGESLTPAGDGTAPFALTFTESPGVVVWWAGQRHGHLPYCACDACDETLAGCSEQLRGWADMVVGGTFGESLSIADDRWWHRVWAATSTGSWQDTRTPVDEAEAERLLELMPDGQRTWNHWPRRERHPGPRTPGGPSAARARVWFDELGWGVVDGPEVPGGCWTHYSQLEMPGFRTLRPGQPVTLDWEWPGQDDWPYRARSVVPVAP